MTMFTDKKGTAVSRGDSQVSTLGQAPPPPPPMGPAGVPEAVPTPAAVPSAIAMRPGASDGQMPALPSMQEPDNSSEMPMPSCQASEPARLQRPAQQPGQFDTQRFVPNNVPAGTAPQPDWEPGLIEVQFREGTRPEVLAGTAASPASFSGPSGTPLAEVNRIARQYGLLRAEPTFQTPHVEATAIQATARQQGIELPHLANFVTMQFPSDADTKRIADELSRLPQVERAVPVPKAIPAQATALLEPPSQATLEIPPEPALAPAPLPTPPAFDPMVGNTDQVTVNPATGLEYQWYIIRCRAPGAWSRSSGAGVVVADVDFGFRTTHQDLKPNIDMSHAFNSYDGSSNVGQGASIFHGTGVLGLAGAPANGIGLQGFAYAATLWPIQANTGAGPAPLGDSFARGIEWVRSADSGGRRKVIILEVQTSAYGNYEQVPSVNVAIRNAIASGCIVCVAAGNGDRDASISDLGTPILPTGSILVGATSYHPTLNRRANFSNFGPPVVVCAPGDPSHDVTCSSNSDTACTNGFGGTSGATPKVAGTAALMLSVSPGLSHAQVRDILARTGIPVTTDPGKPIGTFLNADAAVREAILALGGRLEVFARGSDGALYHNWQTAPNDGWSGWASLGGIIDSPVVARNADGRLEVFVIGTDHALWHMWQIAPNGPWSGWNSLGGWIDRLAVGQNTDGRLEVFARGSDGALHHNWQTAPNNGWSGWASLGGVIDSPIVARNADGRLEVFVIGTDHALAHLWQVVPNGPWSGWQSLGGWIDRLAVGQNADGRLEVFARGSDGALFHKWQVVPNGSWSQWESLGGWIDCLAIARNADGRLEVFVSGSDRALWHKWQVAPNSGWSAWASEGGWIDRLATGQNADGRLELFVRGSDAALYHKWQTAPSNGWSGWASLGGWIDQLTVGRNAF